MIGKHSYVAGYDVGEDPHLDCDIGEYTGIGKGIVIHQSDNWDFRRNLVANFPLPNVSGTGLNKGRVVIGNDVWIGEDVKILSGVKIGDGARVAAHSVVSKSVPPYAMVAGNPAQVKYFRFDPETIHLLRTIAWWKWSDKAIEDTQADFKDVITFVNKYSPK